MTVDRTWPSSGSGSAVLSKLKEEGEAASLRSPTRLTSVSGVDTITATATMPIPANAAGHIFIFVPAGANTTAPTLNVDGRGALPVRDQSGGALPAGYFSSTRLEGVINMGTEFRVLWTTAPASGPTILRAAFALKFAKGTSGGSATGGSVRTRYPFNTSLYNTIPGLTLDTVTNIGRMTVPARDYQRIEARCSFYNTDETMLILRNISDAVDVSTMSRVSKTGTGIPWIGGYASFAASKSIDLQYSAVTAQATNGLGKPVNDTAAGPTTDEMYGVIEFESYA